jgi:Ca2+-binding EF-hand superfamily protein
LRKTDAFVSALFTTVFSSVPLLMARGAVQEITITDDDIRKSFDVVDKNHDGIITMDDMDGDAEVFGRLNPDEADKITFEEYKTYIKSNLFIPY